jgi:phospholipase/carboxylesterase
VLAAGAPLATAKGALILIHGRGASAQSILPLAGELGAQDFAALAPQAAGGTWYPQRFIVPIALNEPYLSSALRVVGEVVAHIEAAGIPAERIVLGGFSQGACLAAEYAARHARRYGGLLVFSGGLIGEVLDAGGYTGSLDGTPVFLGCDDADFHIPKARVLESAEVLRGLGGVVTAKLYSGVGHTIIEDELNEARKIVGERG